MEEENITTIKLTTKTRDLLKQFGIKGEKYEDIIINLIHYYVDNNKKEELKDGRRKNEGFDPIQYLG